MDGFQKEQIRNLRGEGLSYAEIARQVDASRDAVISFCRRNGLQEIKKPITAVKIAAEDVCRECGKPLVQVNGMKRRVFCSKECRVKWWKEHPEQLNQKAVYQYTCPHCGKPFSAYGNAKRKYCSHSCYISDRFGGGADE
ncbi:MAG: RNA polymerase subunit sigma-70 [Solobacterium sp.]|nr:RNA polymerase subunit sigma-70 [Solobacterium sp.]